MSQQRSVSSPFVFVSERGTPFTTTDFARMIERAAITSTAVYTALAPIRFKDFWRE
jgi:site-specific recombinase XerD